MTKRQTKTKQPLFSFFLSFSSTRSQSSKCIYFTRSIVSARSRLWSYSHGPFTSPRIVHVAAWFCHVKANLSRSLRIFHVTTNLSPSHGCFTLIRIFLVTTTESVTFPRIFHVNVDLSRHCESFTVLTDFSRHHEGIFRVTTDLSRHHESLTLLHGPFTSPRIFDLTARIFHVNTKLSRHHKHFTSQCTHPYLDRPFLLQDQPSSISAVNAPLAHALVCPDTRFGPQIQTKARKCYHT